MPRAFHALSTLAALALLSACGPAADQDASGREQEAVGTAADEPAPVLAQTADYEVDPDLPLVRVWKSPTCGCCGDWVVHMRQAGFPVEVHDVQNLGEKKLEHGIAPQHQSCHTATVDGYVVEGHVPADLVKRMLADRPDIQGLTVPGMPAGSPGMEVPGRKDPYDVLALVGDGSVVVYASR
ncbi:MAG: DUF411 domain-containing protein [Gemmatimonadota bacterium]|jgi:hypothetical protein